MSPLTVARVIRVAATVLSMAGVLVVVAISALDYEALKDHLDPLSVDRDAALTEAEFDEVVFRLRLLAAGLAALAAVLVAARGAVDRVLAEVTRSWAADTRAAPVALRGWLAGESRPVLVALGAIVLVATALRLAFIDVPLRYDEATTYNNFVSKPLYVGLAHYPLPNNHLLHTFLAKLSVTAFGGAEWAIRLPALLAGLALVPATFALGRILYGRAAALLGAALVASSSTLVEYSTNARGYTLVALLTLLTLLAAARVLETGSVGAWAVIAVAGALGLHAVPVMLYPLGGVFVWLLLSRLAQRAPMRPLLEQAVVCAAAIAVLTLLLYAPVYAASGIRSVTSNDFVEPTSWGVFFDRVPEHLWDTLDTWDRDLPLVVSVVLAVGLAASLVLTPLLSRFPVPPLLAMVVWIVPVLLVQRVIPFTRVWLFLVPLALLAVGGFYGRLLERVPRARALVPGLAAFVALGAAWAVLDRDSVRESRETGALLDAPAVASFLAGRVDPGDRIFATGSDSILEYYLGRHGVDARPYLYTSERRVRTFLVVNVLGGQVLAHYRPELDDSLGPPRLLRRYPSALVYVVEPRT